MVGALNCGVSAQGLSRGAGHCVVFLTQGVSLHPGIYKMGNGEFTAGK